MALINIVYGAQRSEEGPELETRETAEREQHPGIKLSSVPSFEGHSFRDNGVRFLDTEDRRYERRVRDAHSSGKPFPSIEVVGLKHNLSRMYHDALHPKSRPLHTFTRTRVRIYPPSTVHLMGLFTQTRRQTALED